MRKLVICISGCVLRFPAADVLRDHVDPPLDITEYASPLTSYQYWMDDQKDTALFTVTGLAEGQRIRLATLDTYDGVVMRVDANNLNSPNHVMIHRASAGCAPNNANAMFLNEAPIDLTNRILILTHDNGFVILPKQEVMIFFFIQQNIFLKGEIISRICGTGLQIADLFVRALIICHFIDPLFIRLRHLFRHRL